MNNPAEIIETKVFTPTVFSLMIEAMVKEMGCSYMDAILHYCDRNEFEIEVAGKLLNQTLKARIQAEAEDLHFLPRTEKLPI